MSATLAVDDDLCSSRWFSGKPYILPLAILATPIRIRAIKLAGAFCNAAQAVNAGLNCHLAATLNSVDLLAEWI